jgi:outer membrane protein
MMNSLHRPVMLLACGLLLAPSPAVAEGLGLEDAVRHALAASREAQRTRIAWQEARLAARSVRLRLVPTVALRVTAPERQDTSSEVYDEASGRWIWTDWNLVRESAGLELRAELPLGTALRLGADGYHRDSRTGSYSEETSTRWSASFSQSLIPRGTLQGDLLEAGREVRQRRLEAADALADLRHRVVREYYGLLRDQLAAELARIDLETSRDNFLESRRRYEAGLISESDDLKTELEALQQQAAWLADSLALAERGRGFRRLLQLPGTEPLELVRELPATPEVLETDPAALQAELEGNSRLLRQRVEELKARRDLRIRRLARLPELEISGSWSRQRLDEEFVWNPSDGTLNRSLRLDLSLPLFDRLEARSQERLARLQLRRQRLGVDELREDLQAELDELLSRLLRLEQLQPLRERRVELAERDILISRERYATGLILSRDLIDAERALSLARLERLDNRIGLVLAAAELERLTGRDRRQLEAWLEEERP